MVGGDLGVEPLIVVKVEVVRNRLSVTRKPAIKKAFGHPLYHFMTILFATVCLLALHSPLVRDRSLHATQWHYQCINTQLVP